MWCERRITTVPLPQLLAIAIAASIARSTSHGPGSRWPSQVCTAAREATSVG